MSQTPTQADGASEEYKLGWRATNKLVKQGFSWSGHEPNCAFLNTGKASFADVSSVTGFNFPDDGRSVASADWDFDGDLDLFVTNRTGPRLRFLRNQLNDQGFLQLQLEGRSCNRDAIGARVEVLLLNGQTFTTLHRTRRAGNGYQAQSSSWMHFGLGANAVQSVVVTWPGGEKESFGNVRANRRYRLIQGTGHALTWTPPAKPIQLSPSTPQAPHARSAGRVVLPTPIPMPRLDVKTNDGKPGSLFGLAARANPQTRVQKPLLLQLWASWCAPCMEELAAFAAAKVDCQTAGLDILALNIEAESAHQNAKEALQNLKWTHPSGYASEEAIEILDTLQAAILRQDVRIPIPCSFLIDNYGNLVAFYLGRVAPQQVIQDLTLLPLSASDRRSAALPFPGRWFRPPPQQPPLYLEQAFRNRGLPNTALEYQPGWVHLQFGRALTRQRNLSLAEEQFRMALVSGPYVAEAYAGLGLALHLQKKPTEATNAYFNALQLDPDNTALIYNLGLLLLETKDYAGVQQQIEHLEKLDSPLARKLESRRREVH